MNEALIAKAIIQKTKPLRKHMYIWQVGVLLVACILAVPLIRWFAGETQAKDGYMQMHISDFSTYDPYVFHKVFIPVANCNGMMISLDELSHERYWDVVLGGNYEVRFLKGSKETGVTEIRTTGELSESLDIIQPKLVLSCPDDAVNAGYDTILFLPKSGKSFYLSYLAPIASPEASLVIQPVEVLKPKAYALDGEYTQTGSPYDVQGIFPFFDSVQDNRFILQIKSITSLLDAVLLSVVNAKGKTIALFPDNTILEAYRPGSGLQEYRLPILSGDYEISDLYVCYRYEGDTNVKKAKVNPFIPENDEVYNGTLIRTRDNMSEFSMLKEENNVVTLEGTNVVLNKPLFIPSGKKFLLQAGQTIDLQNGAFIVSRSPVFAEGTADKPVLLTSTDNSVNAGLAVIQAGGRSKLDYLICDNLGEVSSGIWHLTGAVTFYESDVDFNYCRFLNNRSEDGLNTIRCDISVMNCTFKNTYQDAFDSDFCTGVFDGCHFELTGNDAFDVSTSTMTIKNTTFKDIHDKAVSVGERSTVAVEKMYAENLQTGLGAKDSSTLTATDVTIKNAFIGFCSYQKKPEFGPSSITVNGYSLQGFIDFKYLIESKDTLIVDGEQWRATNKKKEAIIIQRMINEEPIK